MGTFPSRSPANRKQGNPLSLMVTVSQHISGSFCLLGHRVSTYFGFIKLKYDLEPSSVFHLFLLLPTIQLSAELKLVRQSL
jgi:hypothetical protein